MPPSTALRWIAYEAEERRLVIVFTNGRRYAYHQVPAHVAAALRSARSRGRYFNAEIRDIYLATELPSPA